LLTFIGCGGSEPVAVSSTPNTDSASSVVGTGGGLVVVPSGAAGVSIPAGSLSQPVTVTVSLLPTTPTPGTGPLVTTLKQYPPYYEFVTSPAGVDLGPGVRVGVCQVTDPSNKFYPPEATHPRLRLAHTVGSGIELLDPVDVTDFLRCTGVTAQAPQRQTRWSQLAAHVGTVVSRGLARLTPRVAYAAHGGLGGKVKSFSPFGAVDPGPTNVATTFAVSARGSFLLQGSSDPTVELPQILDLKALGFVAGDRVRLERLGDFSFTATGPETGTRMIAVFSSTDQLLDRLTHTRVPGALGAGVAFDDEIADTCPNAPLQFDIPEDFLVTNTIITMPAGARYLFVGVLDCFCGDNVDSDKNFAIRVSAP